ncbi:uncharacterized protein PRCAT00004329001 [Priceomyces carsonii]|uniref:uncharacterized protein n=1 Tax=Priceomyces carsonii TaxID=28549 RepID=UPI002ED84015|nr:unnamed protein product [Priceomyces carsonii]
MDILQIRLFLPRLEEERRRELKMTINAETSDLNFLIYAGAYGFRIKNLKLSVELSHKISTKYVKI